MFCVEIEVKFHVTDIPRMRERLAAMGAVPGIRALETNIRFEDARNGLYRNKALLRLRKADKTTLTYKSKPSEKTLLDTDSGLNRQFKILNELEVTVNDFDVMHRILESLGFHAEQIYEKIRETWSFGPTRFCMDEMPFGVFMEIEGKPEAIFEATGLLDLKWPERILCNYLEMFDIIKKKKALSFADATFENFAGIKLDLSDCLPSFYAG